MNVLFTCAGRQSYFVTALKHASRDRGQIYACDSNPDAPALQNADRSFVVPPVHDPGYLAALLEICDQQKVGLLIPSFEPELPLLAVDRALFAAVGTLPVVSSPEIINNCYDKLQTAKFLAGCGLAVPQTFLSLESTRDALSRRDVELPLVIKPRWGVSSIGTAFPEDDEELELSYKATRKQIARTFFAEISATDPEQCILIQERLAGNEYGLDVINDLDGRYICTFVKRKLRMRAGQTDRAVTVEDEAIQKIGQLIGHTLGHVGILDCDALVTQKGCYIIDINPRIGGGYPFSHLAGANIPAALIAWARGDEADPAWFQIEPNVVGSRYDSFIVVKSNKRRSILDAATTLSEIS